MTKKLTKREFTIKHKAYEQGLIEGWQHAILLLRGCIKAHKTILKQKEIEAYVAHNKNYMWKE